MQVIQPMLWLLALRKSTYSLQTLVQTDFELVTFKPACTCLLLLFFYLFQKDYVSSALVSQFVCLLAGLRKKTTHRFSQNLVVKCTWATEETDFGDNPDHATLGQSQSKVSWSQNYTGVAGYDSKDKTRVVCVPRDTTIAGRTQSPCLSACFTRPLLSKNFGGGIRSTGCLSSL